MSFALLETLKTGFVTSRPIRGVIRNLQKIVSISSSFDQ